MLVRQIAAVVVPDQAHHAGLHDERRDARVAPAEQRVPDAHAARTRAPRQSFGVGRHRAPDGDERRRPQQRVQQQTRGRAVFQRRAVRREAPRALLGPRGGTGDALGEGEGVLNNDAFRIAEIRRIHPSVVRFRVGSRPSLRFRNCVSLGPEPAGRAARQPAKRGARHDKH